MVNFYIASSFQNVQQVRELAELLRDKGWKHTFDWTKQKEDHKQKKSSQSHPFLKNIYPTTMHHIYSF